MRLPSRWDTDPEAIVEKQVLPNGGPVFLLPAEREQWMPVCARRGRVCAGRCAPGSRAGELCRGAVPGNCAGEPCRGIVPGSRAGELCRGIVPGSCAGEPCRGTVQGSRAGEPCRGAVAGRLLQGDCCRETVAGRLLQRDCCRETVAERLLQGDCCRETVAGKGNAQRRCGTGQNGTPTPPPTQRAVRRAVRAGRSRG